MLQIKSKLPKRQRYLLADFIDRQVEGATIPINKALFRLSKRGTPFPLGRVARQVDRNLKQEMRRRADEMRKVRAALARVKTPSDFVLIMEEYWGNRSEANRLLGYA